MNRRIVSDFERPNAPVPDGKVLPKDTSDDLDGADLQIAKNFGITKKSELESLRGPYCEMKLGADIVFRDPKKGYEKISANRKE